ncbi:MAG: sigma-70 family RNA polymerase sigma factor [Odoribacteraceae bacterium]|jgi:RNA polymerase sigma-70 factor (ECF subfamily)|nr:sigma-70 family RNA polymerase sigma factor [Odoribacteraceae bacterium]
MNKENVNEKEWLDALAARDNEAYRRLFERFFPALCSFAGKYLDALREEPADVVQDVLFEFWVKRPVVETEIALKTYLYRSVRNKCLDALKHDRAREKYRSRQALEEQSDFFLQQVLEEEVYARLKESIDALPDVTRDVYNLVLLGYDNQQIADMLGLTTDAVKARKRRGKELLKEKLKHLFSLLLPLL